MEVVVEVVFSSLSNKLVFPVSSPVLFQSSIILTVYPSETIFSHKFSPSSEDPAHSSSYPVYTCCFTQSFIWWWKKADFVEKKCFLSPWWKWVVCLCVYCGSEKICNTSTESWIERCLIESESKPYSSHSSLGNMSMDESKPCHFNIHDNAW